MRRMIAIERLLARLFAEGARSPWVVKGGIGLEVRFHLASRGTKDLDLSVPDRAQLGLGGPASLEKLRDLLQQAAGREMADHFTLLIGEVTDRFTAPPEGGARFHVTARVAGRTFEEFHLDVGLGEPLVEDAEWVNGDPVLSFAGIAPARFALLPVPQQIAEKIHA